MKEKKRLDLLLLEQGHFPSREQARAAIMAGEVLVNEVKIEKAGTAVDSTASIRLLGKRLPYVSRGGLKLAKAIDVFGLDLNGLVMIDIGASTGGFVDCALQHQAQKVYAVDVGHNQLAWKLRSDPRVVVLEKTNARTLTAQTIPEQADIVTADVSFISLTLAMPPVLQHCLRPQGQVVVLIKPQFEAGRGHVGKGGIVRDAAVHLQVLEKIVTSFAALDIAVQGLDFSPITGADGNIEYLYYGIKQGLPQTVHYDQVVAAAFAAHRGSAGPAETTSHDNP